jgi:hypothetical protein
MRESTLFGTMFGLGVAAIAIGVVVSRLVVGPAAHTGAEAPAVARETSPPAGPSAAETPDIAPAVAAATTPRPRRPLLPGLARPAASVPASVDQPVAPSPSAPSAPAAGDGGPIAVVRGGPALPAAPGSARRTNGARIIRIDPDGR